MGRNLFFKALHICTAIVLFCCLTGCGVDVYIHNQTQDNISLDGDHIKRGHTVLFARLEPGDYAEWEISRSYGYLAKLYVTCPEELDTSQIRQDTIVITEPERDRFQASAQELTVSITTALNSTEAYGNSSAENLLDNDEDEPAGDLMDESR